CRSNSSNLLCPPTQITFALSRGAIDQLTTSTSRRWGEPHPGCFLPLRKETWFGPYSAYLGPRHRLTQPRAAVAAGRDFRARRSQTPSARWAHSEVARRVSPGLFRGTPDMTRHNRFYPRDLSRQKRARKAQLLLERLEDRTVPSANEWLLRLDG